MSNRHLLFIILFLSVFMISCLPKNVLLEDIYGQKKPEVYKMPAVLGLIYEIEEENNLQKRIYIKLGAEVRGYRKGLIGYIYNRNEPKNRIGKASVTAVYKKYSRAKIIELHYTIEPHAKIYFEVDPKHLLR